MNNNFLGKKFRLKGEIDERTRCECVTWVKRRNRMNQGQRLIGTLIRVSKSGPVRVHNKTLPKTLWNSSLTTPTLVWYPTLHGPSYLYWTKPLISTLPTYWHYSLWSLSSSTTKKQLWKKKKIIFSSSLQIFVLLTGRQKYRTPSPHLLVGGELFGSSFQ